MDITFHYPPELFNLLVDTIPLLVRAKKDVVLFFRGAGVSDDILAAFTERLKTDPQGINKYEIARTTLEHLNKRGEATLRERREVLKRVVEFANFDTCWPSDQLKARGLVAGVRDVVNQKDAFTRMNQAREEERTTRLADIERVNREKKDRADKISAAKTEFYGLFGADMTPQQRGKRLETALNNVFRAYGVLVREAFHLMGEPGEGIIEQIDGVIELKGTLYFVEMKWYKDPIGKAEIAQHLVRLMSRAEGRGIFISASDYTEPAVLSCKEFLPHKLIALAHLQEIVQTLERQLELSDILLRKIDAAQIDKNPYFKPF